MEPLYQNSVSKPANKEEERDQHFFMNLNGDL